MPIRTYSLHALAAALLLAALGSVYHKTRPESPHAGTSATPLPDTAGTISQNPSISRKHPGFPIRSDSLGTNPGFPDRTGDRRLSTSRPGDAGTGHRRSPESGHTGNSPSLPATRIAPSGREKEPHTASRIRQNGRPALHRPARGNQGSAPGTTIVHQRPFLAVDPTAPGNQLPVEDGLITVEAYRNPHGEALPELEITFSPIAPDSPAETTGSPPSTPATATTISDVRGAGLTYEQELFRTKWGWAAFEQTQRAVAQLPAQP